MLKKRQTLVEMVTDVKTNDGVIFRVFVVAVTSRKNRQLKLNSYAKRSRTILLRKRVINEIVSNGAKKSSSALINEVVSD